MLILEKLGQRGNMSCLLHLSLFYLKLSSGDSWVLCSESLGAVCRDCGGVSLRPCVTEPGSFWAPGQDVLRALMQLAVHVNNREMTHDTELQ